VPSALPRGLGPAACGRTQVIVCAAMIAAVVTRR